MRPPRSRSDSVVIGTIRRDCPAEQGPRLDPRTHTCQIDAKPAPARRRVRQCARAPFDRYAHR